MAVKNRSQLLTDNASVFGNGKNTRGDDEKTFNDDQLDSVVMKSGDTFEAGAVFEFDNGSKLREGSIKRDFEGGIARVCTNEKEDQWENGVRSLFEVNGSVIYAESINIGDIPNEDYDAADSYAIGSRFKNLVTGIEYICTYDTNNAAIWEPLSGNVTITSTGDIAFDDIVAMFQWNGNICNFSITGNVYLPINSGAESVVLEFPFEYLNDFVANTDAIMTVNIFLSLIGMPLVTWFSEAIISTKSIRVAIQRDGFFVAETVPMSIVGQFINNPA